MSENNLLYDMLQEFKKLNENIVKFMTAFLEAKQPHLEHTRVEETEELTQDFKGVTIMTETDKAYLVVKNKHQMWVAKSNLQEEYDLGDHVDLLLTEKAENWLPKKSWDKYVPQQKGGKK